MALQTGDRYRELLDVVRRLRAPDGCAWDKKQTMTSLRGYVMEEAFEVVDALDRGSPELLEEELGDLLMQVAMLSVLAEEKGWFGPDDVAEGIRDKLVRRHPHVFEAGHEETDPAVIEARWEAIKAEEKAGRGALEGVPVALPALTRAVKLGKKAGRVGYDWADAAGVREKVDEELRELDEACDRESQEKELGDVLFALASWARHRKIDPEAALRGTLNRFTDRFEHVEAEVRAEGGSLDALDAAELDARWEAAKRATGQGSE
ncbi:MAG: nucleoside triphosphate pyrophosphohydrolase [Sandaracinaceae bacterium]